MPDREFIDIDSLASRWGVERHRIRAWVHRGDVPVPMRINCRVWLWPISQIEEFEREQTRVEKPENMQQEQTNMQQEQTP